MQQCSSALVIGEEVPGCWLLQGLIITCPSLLLITSSTEEQWQGWRTVVVVCGVRRGGGVVASHGSWRSSSLVGTCHFFL